MLGIFFAFLPIFINNPRFTARDRDIASNYNGEFDHDNLKISAESGKIHIDGNSGWAAFKAAGNCTGNGTYSEPYVIEDLVIDGEGSGSCIFIENSDVYFRIENCTLYNAGGFKGGDDAGILLSNVDNSQLINNNCSSNVIGLNLESSDNNTISENIVNYNSWIGIRLVYSEDNIISGNTVNNNTNYGILTYLCFFNNISTNVIKNNNIIGIYSNTCSHNTISGNTLNNNSHGIYLYFNSYNTISGNTANNNSYGIYYNRCSYNTISGNTANNNSYGIYLTQSHYNIISGNTLLGNEQCIAEENCRGNKFSDNGSCTYGEGDEKPFILGYNLLLLLGLLSLISILIYFLILIFKKS